MANFPLVAERELRWLSSATSFSSASPPPTRLPEFSPTAGAIMGDTMEEESFLPNHLMVWKNILPSLDAAAAELSLGDLLHL